jgi:hypothetical protein
MQIRRMEMRVSRVMSRGREVVLPGLAGLAGVVDRRVEYSWAE